MKPDAFLFLESSEFSMMVSLLLWKYICGTDTDIGK